jgi:hypothetical protein
MFYSISRTFSVKESRKYAEVVDDNVLMSQSFTGVVGTNDVRNFFSIGANNPSRLLSRIEGMVIPVPNHFDDVTFSGGVSSLLAQALAKMESLIVFFIPIV